MLTENSCFEGIKNHGYLKIALRRWNWSAEQHSLTAGYNQCGSGKFPHSKYDFVFYPNGNSTIQFPLEVVLSAILLEKQASKQQQQQQTENPVGFLIVAFSMTQCKSVYKDNIFCI